MKTIILTFISIFPLSLVAQNKITVTYIEQYKQIAIDEMKRTGIPASITLAQAIVESNSGESVLAKKSNNHFGIKCKSDWKGATTLHDDDLRQECFRVYENVAESYKDHSDFLKSRPHYAPLFQLDPVDDSAWAYGLKKAGYATAPDYPKKLLKVIDDYELSQYNFSELEDEVEISENSEIIQTVDSLMIKDKMEIKDTVKTIVPTSQPNPTDTFIIKVDTMNSISTKQTNSLLPLDSTSVGSPTNLIVNRADSSTIQSDSSMQVNPVKGLVQSGMTSHSIPNQPNRIGNTITTVNKVEQFKTQVPEFADNEKKDTIEPSKNITQYYPEGKFKVNQILAIWAKRGSSLLNIAIENKVPLYKIFEFNELSETDLLQKDQLIFLAPKKKEGQKSIHIVKEGETLYDISQTEGIQTKYLLTYNNILQDAKLMTGSSLLLTQPKEQKISFSTINESLKTKNDSSIKKDWNFFKKKQLIKKTK